MHTLIRLYLALVFCLLAACSSTSPTLEQAKPNDVLSQAIAQTRVVLASEIHTNYGHHLNQLDVIKKSHQKWGGVISIGLEMVQQPYQQSLDDYIAGTISERDMLKGVEWYSRWRFDYRLYRPIFDYAKQHKIPLIALNIPQEMTRQISKAGIQSLSPKDRKLLPALIDKSNTEYTASLKNIFGQHSHGKSFNEKGFKKFEEAQLAWDEGMAFSASKYLSTNPNKRMVILAGSGHLMNRHGIPSRIDRQLQLSGKQRALVILSHEDKEHSKEVADFSLKAKTITLPPLGLIGIGMKDTKQGVQISLLSKDGAAEKAGLEKGDILVQLNTTKIMNSGDVSLWRLDKKPNEKVKVLYKRDKQNFTTTLSLGSPN